MGREGHAPTSWALRRYRCRPTGRPCLEGQALRRRLIVGKFNRGHLCVLCRVCFPLYGADAVPSRHTGISSLPIRAKFIAQSVVSDPPVRPHHRGRRPAPRSPRPPASASASTATPAFASPWSRTTAACSGPSATSSAPCNPAPIRWRWRARRNRRGRRRAGADERASARDRPAGDCARCTDRSMLWHVRRRRRKGKDRSVHGAMVWDGRERLDEAVWCVWHPAIPQRIGFETQARVLTLPKLRLASG